MIRYASVFALLLLAGCGCNDLKESIERQIDSLNYCSNDDECTITSFGCPFDCHSLVNMNADTASIRAQIEEYDAKCEQCVYGCIAPPQEFECKNSKCFERGG